jgi:hypothetical protein
MKLAWISDSSDNWLCTCTTGQLQSPAMSGEVDSEREGRECWTGIRRTGHADKGYTVENIVPARKDLQRPPGVCMLMHAKV